ncbi:MAG: RNA-binding protein [Elusimicrobia bacterium]|nr:RNA-binding protein [Elusimicrobiota bacterium]
MKAEPIHQRAGAVSWDSRRAIVAKKLYVGGLPFDTTEDQLHAVFTACGQVTSTKLIMDKFSGQSRGFAFVEMPDDAEALAAIQKLNGSPLGNRKISVNEARPMEPRAPGGGFGGGGGGGYGGGGGRGGHGGGGGRGGHGGGGGRGGHGGRGGGRY